MHLPLTRLDRYTTFFSPQWRSISSQLSPLFVKSILPTPRHNGPISIYTQVRPTTALKHVHTPTRARAHAHAHNTHVVRRANFSSIARIPSANPLPSPRFYYVFWHRGFVWPTPSNDPFEQEPILSERVFPPPCENIGHSNSLSFLITRRFAIVSDRTEYRVTGTHHIMGLNK